MKRYLSFLVLIAGSGLLVLFSCSGTEKKTDQKSLTTGSCDSLLDKYYKEYLSERKELMEKRNGQMMIPIDTAYGNAYREAYLRENGKDLTEGVSLDIKTVAFLFKYLLDHPDDSIGLSLARYNDKYFTIGRNITADTNYTRRINAANKNRLALIIGTWNNRFSFFIDKGTGMVFYDDWNEEWP